MFEFPSFFFISFSMTDNETKQEIMICRSQTTGTYRVHPFPQEPKINNEFLLRAVAIRGRHYPLFHLAAADSNSRFQFALRDDGKYVRARTIFAIDSP